jgi:hypothetical protein
MSPRDDDLAKLAGLCGWKFLPATKERRSAMFAPVGIVIPTPDATLSEQLAFAGMIAEELVPTVTIASRLIQQDFVEGVLRKCKADTDLAHAAVRAALEAIAAKGAT